MGSKSENRRVFCWDLWKMNAKLLDDDVFTDQVQAVIENIVNGKQLEYGARWELAEQEIKMIALERASAIKRDERKNEMFLRNNLQTLLKEECRMPGAFKDDISSLKDKLEILDRERYRGAIVRARAERWATGEAPTKRALSLEKSYARRNDITEIERDGAVTSDKEEIESAFFEYYNRLF
ncbi:unnamed protein product, partial [Ixodes pacificus]